ncbi:MAG: L-glutamate gamma-semialdehyde dehydrogenase [Gemmataceae bacterium]|nr:L-glutamate gamma-semialdehyde dehydrogenase [Gemmataceae bacterium]MDW8242154.1 L-glutamate gamma-semialdehyde dehydrogenase [Thermogemmata sp.]
MGRDVTPVLCTDTIERRTQQWGRELFARLEQYAPLPLSRSWWDDQLLRVGLHHPALKVQLFRFVDTLPTLGTPEDVTDHLLQYLEEARDDLPAGLLPLLSVWPRRGLLAALTALAARWGTRRLARRFIAGTTISEALTTLQALRRRHLAFTLDLLGEATLTEAEADAVQKQYLELIRGLASAVASWPPDPRVDADESGPIPRLNVSVKLSALYSQFDPINPEAVSQAVRSRLRPILSLARQVGAFVNIDMEQYAVKDLTLRIFREVLEEPDFRDWADVGIAVQAYLRDTPQDLHALLHWVQQVRQCPIWIRLVKGAYWDYETVIATQNGWPIPVYTHKWESDLAFEQLSDFLLDHHQWLRPAFGTHNIRSMAHVLAAAEARRLPWRHFEFQMLHGMGEPIQAALQSLGCRVRIYTPFGQLLPGMAYLVRRLLENSSNDSFLRQGFAEGTAEEILLMNPKEHGRNGATLATTTATEIAHTALSSAAMSQEGQTPRWLPTDWSPFRNEPHSDFSRAEVREKLRHALQQVRSQLGGHWPLVVAGTPVTTGRWLDSLNPSRTAEVVGRVALASATEVQQAVIAARRAFPAWRDTPARQRAELLRRLAAELRNRRWELTAWIIYETGKPWREADADVAEAIDFCEYYAREMLRLAVPRTCHVAGEDNSYFYEPRGVAVVIAPWNFPLAILTGMASAALVTGNTVILKPAEQSSVVAAQLMDCLQSVGVPPGVVQYLPGIGEEIGPLLVEHPDVSIITFTGSMKVGLWINEVAARTPPGQDHVKRVIAEMGGKNAIIVDTDADLDEAVKGVVESAFGYSGQKCSACSRVIILEPLYEVLLERLIEATRSLIIAPADDPGCFVGPLIDAEAQQRVRRVIAEAQHYARLVYQADVGPLAEQGYFVGPAIFADVPEDSPLAQEEIFGPVLAVLRARDLDDALRIANGTPYALTGGCYSRHPARLQRIIQEFRVGNLYINRKITGALVERQPFGGFRRSGIGSKAGGPDYLLQFVWPRTVTINQLRRGFAPDTVKG